MFDPLDPLHIHRNTSHAHYNLYIQAGRDVHSTSVAFVGAVKAHITDPDEPDESLTASARAVTDAVASLLKTLRYVGS